MTRAEFGTRNSEEGILHKENHLPHSTLRVPRFLILLLLTSSLFLGGCANVKPWEREILSRPGMQVDPLPMISGCDDHIYFSREASKGGRSYAGGGCGCN